MSGHGQLTMIKTVVNNRATPNTNILSFMRRKKKTSLTNKALAFTF